MPHPDRTQPESPRPAPRPFTFICTACETVEHRRTPALPQHWATEEVTGDIYAYCPTCADDLPRGAIQ